MPLNVIGLNNIAPAIMQYGTESQKRTLLPRMMRADDIWCQGMSEPEAGSDLAALRTRAVRDGDDFIVNGQRSGRRWDIGPTGASSTCAPIPTLPSTRGSPV